VLDDLRALLEFAHAGSIAGAADRLFPTPSAITRQVQRLEPAFGAELLDRSAKPPRLNSLGSKVLEQARELLKRAEAMKWSPRCHPCLGLREFGDGRLLGSLIATSPCGKQHKVEAS
jgi:DNA-binding transcriptional LysR family regulator